MDVFHTYVYSTAGWLSLQGIPLIGMPQIISRIMLDETRQPSPAEVEIYFARCLGFSLLTLAVLTIILTGTIPLSSAVSESVSTEDTDPKAPYAVPTLVVTSVYHAISAFNAYTWYITTDQVAFAVALVGYFIVASIGLWCALFASSHGKISRKTGEDIDKRTAESPIHEAQRMHVEKSE